MTNVYVSDRETEETGRQIGPSIYQSCTCLQLYGISHHQIQPTLLYIQVLTMLTH